MIFENPFLGLVARENNWLTTKRKSAKSLQMPIDHLSTNYLFCAVAWCASFSDFCLRCINID